MVAWGGGFYPPRLASSQFPTTFKMASVMAIASLRWIELCVGTDFVFSGAAICAPSCLLVDLLCAEFGGGGILKVFF